MLVVKSDTRGLPPPRLTKFSTGVFGEGRLSSPEKERWEGAPERLILAFYQLRSLKMCWKIVGTLGPRWKNPFTNPIQKGENGLVNRYFGDQDREITPQLIMWFLFYSCHMKEELNMLLYIQDRHSVTCAIDSYFVSCST